MNATEIAYLLNQLGTSLRHYNNNHNHDEDLDHLHDHNDNSHDHDNDEHNDANDGHSLIIAKAIAMSVLFCASTLCGSIPFILNRWLKWTENSTNARSSMAVKCLLYFGGGVLLCTTFQHLLPEVKENIEKLQMDKVLPETQIHLAELLMCCGFFAMFLVEELIHSYIHRHNNDNTDFEFKRGRSIRDSYLVRKRDGLESSSASDEDIKQRSTEHLSVKDLLSNDLENQKYQQRNHHQHHDHQLAIIAGSENNNFQKKNNKNNNRLKDHNCHNQHTHNETHQHVHEHAHSHLPITPAALDEDVIVASLRGLLIVLALSLHELFEGLAVGLEAETKNVWYMLYAVSCHKLVLAFCVGVELIVTRTKLWLSIIYVLTFAVVSPIGIGIGILISSNGSSTASAIPSAILQGLATGTLLYVVFFEILSKERSGLIPYLAFVIGFAVMFGLQYASGHEHTHSHGGPDHSHGHGHDHDHSHEDDEHLTETGKNIEEQLKFLREAAKNLNIRN